MVRAHNNIFTFTFFNYVDKGLTFIIPFIILKTFNEAVYASLEYLISISLIASSFLPLGLNSYLFFLFKNKQSGKEYELKRDSILNLIFTLYGLICIIIYLVSKFNGFILFCSVRSYYLTYISLLSAKMRIEDKPLYPLLISCFINIVILLLIFLAKSLSKDYNLLIYSIPYIVLYMCIFFRSFKSICGKSIKYSLYFLLEGLRFSWPLLITTGIVGIQNNFVKIYGYNSLSVQEYSSLSIMIRCFTIALLAYTAAGSFYQKMIYSKENYGLLPKIYIKYQLAVLLGFALMSCFIIISNHTNILPEIPIGKEFWILFFTYVILFNRAYLENFFGKYGKLRYILYSLGTSFLIFIFALALLIKSNCLDLTSLLSLLLIVEVLDIIFLSYFYFNKIKPIERWEIGIK